MDVDECFESSPAVYVSISVRFKEALRVCDKFPNLMCWSIKDLSLLMKACNNRPEELEA